MNFIAKIFNFLSGNNNIAQKQIEVEVIQLKNNNSDFIDITERVKGCTADIFGLYPHEILILSYAPTFILGQNKFQSFWESKYGILNMNEILNSLIERKFLSVGNSSSTLEFENISTLKEILRKNDLKTTGNKKVLVERIQNNLNIIDLNNVLETKRYILNADSKDSLKNNEYVSFVHKHGVFLQNIFSFNKIMNKKPLLNYREKVQDYLWKSSKKFFNQNNIDYHIACIDEISYFLIEDEKYNDALTILSEILFYNLNIELAASPSTFDIEILKLQAQNFFEYKTSILTVPPKVIKNLKKCQEKLELSDNEISNKIKENILSLQKTSSIFTIQEILEIYLHEKYQRYDILENIYSNTKSRFIEKYGK